MRGPSPSPPAAASLPAAALPTLLHNPPPRWVCQLPPCCESSLPSCLSLPLLQVWMSVFSLTLWLLNFHTVQFSVSSGCFLFLNCCSFGCARIHSVSTYASILATHSTFRCRKWKCHGTGNQKTCHILEKSQTLRLVLIRSFKKRSKL